MKNRILFLIISCIVNLSYATANEHYPTKMAIRLFGTNQGNVGDCHSEAEVSALEQAFINHGVAVKLSLFHRHAHNWMNNSPEEQKKVNLLISDQDKSLLTSSGDFVPEYIWPEDTEGYNPYLTGDRPHAVDAMVWDPQMPTINQYSYSSSYQSFTPGFRNSSNLDGLKQAIDSGKAVVLSVHAHLIMNTNPGVLNFNKKTGLLNTKYDRSALEKVLSSLSLTFENGIHHSVAVVGYDDNLYAGTGLASPGAIIVRNSWNDDQEISASHSPNSPEDELALKQFRLRLATVNLPGYYAIPYQYIQDIIAAGIGGFVTYSLDFVSYAQNYIKYQKEYQIIIAPYSCDAKDFFGRDKSLLAKGTIKKLSDDIEIWNSTTSTVAEKEEAGKEVWSIANQEVGTRNTSFGYTGHFQFAKLARNSRLGDTVGRFYSGQFNSYYCTGGDSENHVWPDARVASQPSFQTGLEKISANVYSPLNWISFMQNTQQAITEVH